MTSSPASTCPLNSVKAMVGSDADYSSIELYCVFIGILLLIMAAISMMQPVKMLPILLVFAGLAFIFLGIWFKEDLAAGKENYRAIVGVLWLIAGLISTYMAAAISLLVIKGKQVLPLLIKS